MSVPLLYAQNWSKGGSAFCKAQGTVFLAPSGGPVVDSLYPEIAEAESVKVVEGAGPNGENVLDCDTSAGADHVSAGVLIYAALAGISFSNLSRYEVKIWNKPTTAALDAGMAYALPYWGRTFGGFSYGEVALDETGGLYRFNIEAMNTYFSQSSANISRSYIENFWFESRIRFSNAIDGQPGIIRWEWRRQDQTAFTLVHELSVPAITGDNDIVSETTAFGIGYNGLLGQTTGLRIYGGWTDDAAEEKPSGCCATEGTAGGGITGIDGVVTPVGERTWPNGESPSYTADPGGGELAAGSDPSAPPDLSAADDPVVHIALTTADAVVNRWSDDHVNAGTTSPPLKRKVVQFSSIPVVTLAGRDGVIPSPGFDVLVADHDKEVMGWMSGSNRFLLNRYAEILIEEYGQRMVDAQAMKLAAGYVVDWEFIQDAGGLFTRLQFGDLLSSSRSPLSLTKPLPKRLVRKELFPQAPEGSLGRPVPIYYGELTDDYQWSLDPSRAPNGIIAAIDVGWAHQINFTNLLIPWGTPDWRAALISGHCMANLTGAFCWNGSINTDESEATRGRVPVVTDYTTDILLPTMPGWATYFSGNGHVRVQGSDGSLEDFCMAFFRGPRGAYMATGQFPPTFNGVGVEDVGDGTGDAILNPAHQLAHFICYWVFGDYRYGAWGALPAYPDSTLKFNRSSVDTVNSLHFSNVSGGLKTAFGVGAWGAGGGQRSGAEVLAELQRGTGIRLGMQFSQMFMTALDHGAAVNSLVTFGAHQMAENSFKIDPDIEEFENHFMVEGGLEWGTGRVSVPAQTFVNSLSAVQWGHLTDPVLKQNPCAYRADTMQYVAGRELLWKSTVPHTGSFITNLQGLNLRGGQLIKVTSEFGLGSTGWTERVLMVTGMMAAVNGVDGEMTDMVLWEDVHDIVSTPTSIVAGMEGPMWAKPIGSSGSGTSQPIGSSATGTSRRIG